MKTTIALLTALALIGTSTAYAQSAPQKPTQKHSQSDCKPSKSTKNSDKQRADKKDANKQNCNQKQNKKQRTTDQKTAQQQPKAKAEK